MRLKAGVVSDCGHVRSANEDSFLVRPGLYAVSDGMGGARAGEVASQMACFGLMGVDPASAGPKDLHRVIVSVNKAIVGRSAAEAHLLGMGTTLTAVLIRDGGLILAHVGDSRGYLFRDGVLTQMTDDHSWVGEMVRRGELTPAQAAVHPHRSVITRALGTDEDVEPDIREMPAAEGDRVLLCSDGLTGMVADAVIAEVLRKREDPQATAEALVREALAAGGEDNVTVVVVDLLPDIDPDTGEEPGRSWADDRILIGPSDRTASVAASAHRVRRAGEAMRERLGRLTVPQPRPVGARGGGRAPAGAAAPGASETAEPGPAGEPAAPTTEPTPTAEPVGPAEPAAANAATEAAEPAKTVKVGEDVQAKASGRRRKRRLWIFWALAVLLILAIAVAGFAYFNSTVYYVGEYQGGVALFHGLPGSVLGYELSSVVEQGSVAFSALSPYMQERVNAHDLVSKEEGQRFLRSLSGEQ
jgi:protein phosphatase